MRVVLLASGFSTPPQPPPAWDDLPLAVCRLGDASVFDELLDTLATLGPVELVLVVREQPEGWRLALTRRKEPIEVTYPLRGALVRTMAARASRTAPTLFVDARCAPSAGDLRRLVEAGRPDSRVRLGGPGGDLAQVWCPLFAARALTAGSSDDARCLAPGPGAVPSARTLDELHATGLRRAEAAPGGVLLGPGAVIEEGATVDGPAVIGPNCTVRAGATVQRTVLIAGTHVGAVELVDAVVAGDRLWSGRARFSLRVEDAQWIAPRPRPIRWDRRARRVVVRAVEVLAAGAALAVLAPLLALFAVAVRLDSRGPVLYASDRLVRAERNAHSREGYAHEPAESVPHIVFRTMVPGADRMRVMARNVYQGGPYSKFDGDERITRVGHLLRKTSVDELPLLWNVLVGRFGLVGLWPLPRGEATAIATRPFPLGSREMTATARRRFEGRPGLAGMWQAGGRSRVTAEARALFDAYQAVVFDDGPAAELLEGEYARYSTLAGHARCLFDTLARVVRREGAL